MSLIFLYFCEIAVMIPYYAQTEKQQHRINMNKQQYSSPYSKVVKVIIPAGLCQGSPLDSYLGNDLGDDFEEE